jgi:hypothetical protein
MNTFERKFSLVLEADDDAPVAAPENDKEAMAQSLDTAKPNDFDVRGGREQIVDHRKKEQAQKLTEWIAHIDEFIKYLNSTDASSMQVQLHTAACDSMFEDIARSEKKKIARLAAELSSLSESLKGYLISSNDK